MSTNLREGQLAICTTLFSCNLINFKDEITNLQNQIDNFNEEIKEINESIGTLQILIDALESKVYVSAVTPITEDGIETGYMIAFTNGKQVIIKNGTNGKDGQTPIISIRQDTDSNFYWTVNGSWLLDDNGEKIRANGIQGQDGEKGEDGNTPQLKIEDGFWFISTDNGQTWKNVGKATGEDGKDGQDGTSIFTDVTFNDDFLYITINNEEHTIITLPRYKHIVIELSSDSEELAISSKETLDIQYYIQNADENTQVTAASDGNYGIQIHKTDQNSGYVSITAPMPYVDGFINIIAYDNNGYADIKTINFYERIAVFSDGTEFSVSPQGGDIVIPISYNFEYSLEIDEDAGEWLSIIQTKAPVVDGAIIVRIKNNDTNYARTGKIYVTPVGLPGRNFATIVINQNSAYFSIDYTNILSGSEGGEYESHIKTTRGISYIEPDDCDWLQISLERKDNENYTFTFNLTPNYSNERRFCDIPIYSENGLFFETTIQIVQLPFESNPLKDLVFTVRANVSNNYRVYLPISGENDYYVDWGDGTVEHHQNTGYIYHQYDTVVRSYDVIVSGHVSALSFSNLQENLRYGITAVKQWGNTGLTSMGHAFEKCTSLEYVAGNTSNAFDNVQDFINTFAFCKGLKSIPANLFGNCKMLTSMYETFAGCSKITSIPTGLLSQCPNVTCFRGTFAGLHGIKTIPEDLFSSCIHAENMEACFEDVIQIETVPGNLFKNCPEIKSVTLLFHGCYNLSTVPSDLFAYSPMISDFLYTFSNCRSLKEIDADLFKNNRLANSFMSTFEYVNLSEIPAAIFDNNKLVTSFERTFEGSTNFNCESPYSIIDGKKVHLYERENYPDIFVIPIATKYCFYNNDQWADYDNIPSDWR